ncbi:hypothetical protein GQ53DRAFT_653152 [Thozetella sp. PMI_491]|nr:hypothetical protein GQ53DRAFT_653152 [Thozetella sp. PMI_491]
MDRPTSGFRPLLPRIDGQSVQEPEASATEGVLTQAGRLHKAVACNLCRARKMKCDGLKPRCTRCARRQQSCSYQASSTSESMTLKQKNQDLQNASLDMNMVLELLRTAPEHVAAAVLQDLREGASAAEVLGRVRSATPLPPPLSSFDVDRTVAAPTYSALEFDLSRRYPHAFPALVPLGVEDFDLSLLGIGRNTARDSKPRASVASPAATAVEQFTGEPRLLPQRSDAEPSSYADQYLNALEIHRWTAVPVSSSFAARTLSFYLCNEHPVLALFDADLLVRDLIGGEGPFCTPLLASSLFSWCCATYGQMEPQATQVSRAFLVEAKIRWLEEGRHDAVTTVAAGILLALSCNHHGSDRDGLTYLDATAEMGGRLGLFGTEAGPASPLQAEDEHARVFASFAAWGAFAWHTLHSVHFRRKHRIRHPPTLPIPGDEPDKDSKAHRDSPLALYMGSTFTWIFKFWRIVHEIHEDDSPSYITSPLLKAETGYRKLLTWSSQLPADTRRHYSCPHHVLILHIWYHTAIMDLWRPFLDASNGVRLQTFSSADNVPIAAYNASVQQLKRLVFLFRKRFESNSGTVLVTPGLLYLVNEVLRESESAEAQFYFVLSTRGCLSMASWCPGLCGVTKGLFSLAWRNGLLQRRGWADGVIKDLQQASKMLTRHPVYSSLYPIDLDSGTDAIESVSMEMLANDFHQLAHSGELDKDAEDMADEQPEAYPLIWKGDVRDLNLTLAEPTHPESWDKSWGNC